MTEKGGPGICGKSAFCSIFLSVYNCSTNKIHFKKTMACCNNPLETPGKKGLFYHIPDVITETQVLDSNTRMQGTSGTLKYYVSDRDT